MDTEFLEDDSALNSSDVKATEFAIANVSCQYDGSPGNIFKNIVTFNIYNLQV